MSIAELFFGGTFHIISFALIIGAACFITYVVKNRATYRHWEKAFYIMFTLGLFMSIAAGTRDSIGTADGFPTEGALFITLCALGVLGFIILIIGLLSKLSKSKTVFRYGTYVLMAIIVVKTLLVQGKRVIEFLQN